MAELLIFLFIHPWGFIFVFLMIEMMNKANFSAIAPGVFPKGAQPGASRPFLPGETPTPAQSAPF